MYLELYDGDFDRDGKKAQKNVEVKITVWDKDGRHVPVCNFPPKINKMKLPILCYLILQPFKTSFEVDTTYHTIKMIQCHWMKHVTW